MSMASSPSSHPSPYAMSPSTPIQSPRGSDSHLQFYFKANLDLPPAQHVLSPQQVHFHLTQINNVAPQLKFNYITLNQPPPGSIHVIAAPHTLTQLPPDGYAWMDSETTTVYSLDASIRVQCFSRKQGFVSNASHTSISKYRYRLLFANGHVSHIQLLHYLPAGKADIVKADMNSARMHPTKNRPPTPSPFLPPPTKVREEIDPEDPDILMAADIAYARWKSRDDWMREIVSGYAIADIVEEEKDNAKELEWWKQKKVNDEKQIETMRDSHKQKMAEWEMRMTESERSIQELEGLETTQEIEEWKGVMGIV